MKKKVFAVTILAAIIFIVGVLLIMNQDTDIATKTFQGDTISFEYPENWVVARSNLSESDTTVVNLVDPEGVNENANPSTILNIQRFTTSGLSLEEGHNNLMAEVSKTSGFKLISQRSITVDGVEAYEDVFQFTNKQGEQKIQKQVLMRKDGIVYGLFFAAKKEDFKNEQPNFDIILNTFKVL